MPRCIMFLVVLALAAPWAGCIDGGATPPAPDERAASSPVSSLVVLLEVDPGSAVPFKVLRTSVPNAPAAAWTDTPTVAPGRIVPIASMVLDKHAPAWESAAELRVHDGLGERVLTLDIGPWSPASNATVRLALNASRPGDLQVTAVLGPANLRETIAIQTYGLLYWPANRAAAIEGFPHVIHVPAKHPNLWADEPATYTIDVDDAKWFVDGEPKATGSTLRLVPEPGRHIVSIEAPTADGVNTWNMGLVAWGREVMNDTIIMPTPRDVNRDVAPWEHPFEVLPGTLTVTIELGGAQDTPNADLDLYVLNDEGAVVAQSAATGPAHEVITLGRGTDPGMYTLRVVSRDTPVAAFSLVAIASY